jgi:hypothetical protein
MNTWARPTWGLGSKKTLESGVFYDLLLFVGEAWGESGQDSR